MQALPPKRTGGHASLKTQEWRRILDATTAGEWVELPLRSTTRRYRHPEYEFCQRTIPGRGLVIFGRRLGAS